MRSRIPTTTRVNLRPKTGTLKHEALFWFRWLLRQPEVRGTSRGGRVFVLFSCVAVHGQKKAKQSYAGFGLFGCGAAIWNTRTALTHKFSRVEDLGRPCKCKPTGKATKHSAPQFSLSLSASDLNPAKRCQSPNPTKWAHFAQDPTPSNKKEIAKIPHSYYISLPS